MGQNSCENEEAYGAEVAHAAFRAMDAEKERSDGVKSDAKAFIEACEKEDRNPIDVVRFIAGQAGLKLSGDRPDGEKGKTYDLLREVVDNVVEEVFDDVLESDGKSQDDSDDDMDPTILVARPVRKTRIVKYAFTW